MNNYQTGTAADINVLLNTLDTWLVSTVGYTRNLTPTTVGSGARAHYQITTPRGNTLYVNFRSFRKEQWDLIQSPAAVNYTPAQAIDGLMMNLSKAYAGTGVLWDLQGGQPHSGDNYFTALGVHAGAYNNIPAYHFFHLSNPHMIVIVLEWQLGWFTHLIWGEPDSNGAGSFSPNNGYFFFGSCNNYVPFNESGNGVVFPDPEGFYAGLRGPEHYYQNCRVLNTNLWYMQNVFFQLDPTLHTGANGWLGAPDNAAYSTRYSTHDGSTQDGTNHPGLVCGQTKDTTLYTRIPKMMPQIGTYTPMRRSVNDAAGVTVFFPIMMWWWRSFTKGVYLGAFPEVYYVNLKTFTPNQVVTLGSDQYKIFPWGFKPNPFTYDYNTGIPYYRADQNHGMGMAIKIN